MHTRLVTLYEPRKRRLLTIRTSYARYELGATPRMRAVYEPYTSLVCAPVQLLEGRQSSYNLSFIIVYHNVARFSDRPGAPSCCMPYTDHTYSNAACNDCDTCISTVCIGCHGKSDQMVSENL